MILQVTGALFAQTIYKFKSFSAVHGDNSPNYHPTSNGAPWLMFFPPWDFGCRIQGAAASASRPAESTEALKAELFIAMPGNDVATWMSRDGSGWIKWLGSMGYDKLLHL